MQHIQNEFKKLCDLQKFLDEYSPRESLLTFQPTAVEQRTEERQPQQQQHEEKQNLGTWFFFSSSSFLLLVKIFGIFQDIRYHNKMNLLVLDVSLFNIRF